MTDNELLSAETIASLVLDEEDFMKCGFCGESITRRLNTEELLAGEALCDTFCTVQDATFWSQISATTGQRREFHGPGHPRAGQEVTDFDRRFSSFDDQKG